MDTQSVRCEAITAAGKRCGQPNLTGEDFCLFHSNSDAAQAKRAEGRAVNGRRSKMRISNRETQSVSDIRADLVELIAQLKNQDVSKRDVTLLLRAYESLIKIVELEDIESRLDQLEGLE